MIIGANWRLENAKSPAGVLPGKQPGATCMNEYTAYLVCTWYLVPAMYKVPGIGLSRVSKLVTTALLSLMNRITNRRGHWVGADN